MLKPLRLVRLPVFLFVMASVSRAVCASLPAPDPNDGGISLPFGFHATVFADNLGKIRFLTVATNGDVYVKKNSKGLFALRDSTGSGHADVIKSFAENIERGTGVALHGDWLYFSSDEEVYRMKIAPGELLPIGEIETVVTGLPRGQRQHESKIFAFDESENLYVEVGSPSNASAENDRSQGATGKNPAELFKQHGGYWRFKANLTNQDQLKDGYHFSTGMRHSVSIAWHPISKSLFVFMMGRDQLNTVDPERYTPEYNAENPAEEMHLLKEGANFGWPFTYWDPQRGCRMISPEFGGDNRKRDISGNYPVPLVSLPAHYAPLQMAIYTGKQFPKHYLNGAFVASHGSWNRGPLPQAGYKVMFLPFYEDGTPSGNYETFADNFAEVPVIISPNDAQYRPCGVAMSPEGSLFVSDSEKGRIWRIFYDGNASMIPAVAKANGGNKSISDTAPNNSSTGSQLYTTYCAVCHMADGGGVTGMQPPLKGSARVTGDVDQLIRIVLEGPAKVLPADRPHYSNAMPPWNILTDEQISQILSYVRKTFSEKKDEVTPAQVAKMRLP
jgi:glucose/arabinose dehydrogenase/mono/diheme cytochrome c family protein